MGKFTLNLIMCAMLSAPAMARAQVVVVSKSVHEQEVDRGESYTGQIRLRNDGNAAQEVRIYQTDYLFYADGRTLYDTPGGHVRSNANWLRINPLRVVVPAGHEVEVMYTVNVPAVESAGTYWSAIMLEPLTAGSPESSGSGRKGEVGIRTVVRFAVQIATHVRGPDAHQLRIGGSRMVVNSDGTRHLQFELVNEGAVGYRPKVSLEVYDSQGQLVVTHEAQRGLIYPGTSALQRFALDDLKPGSYEAMVAVDTSALELFGAQFKLTVGPAK